MSKTKLIPMTEFVNDILDYANESQNYERSIRLIEWYRDLLNEKISIEMFRGEDPLFPGFDFIRKSEDVFLKDTVWITYVNKRINESYCIPFKEMITVEDLCSLGLEFNTTEMDNI